jgi:hypothetical protein
MFAMNTPVYNMAIKMKHTSQILPDKHVLSVTNQAWFYLAWPLEMVGKKLIGKIVGVAKRL